MQNPGRYTSVTILLTTIAFCTLAALLLLVAVPQDDRLIVLFGYVSIVILLVMVWAAFKMSRRKIPAGKAMIVKSGMYERAIAGPAEIAVTPFLDQPSLHELRQKPTDLTCECNSRDHFIVRVSLTVIWDALPDGLPDIAAKRINLTDIFQRLVQARLLFECNRFDLDELPHRLTLIAERVRDYLNQPENSEAIYQVKNVLITNLRLPPEVTAAAIRLKESQVERDIARTKRDIHFKDQAAEAKAHAVGLELLDEAVRAVDPRTMRHHETETAPPKTQPEV